MKLPVDNSAISTIATCERKYQLAVLQGLQAPANREADFGKAFHKSVEHLDKGENVEDVINNVFKDAPMVDKVLLLKALVKFKMTNQVYPAIELDNKPALEYKFSIPCYEQNDYEIFLEGTIDRVQLNPDTNQLQVIDYKTSAMATAYLAHKTKKEYELAFQLPFYFFALSRILPEVYQQYLTDRRYSTEIWLVFYNMERPFQKIIRPPFNPEFITGLIPDLINNRIKQMLRIVELNNQNQTAPYTGMNVYGACSRCQFRAACQVAGTAREQELLRHFPRKPYDPLNF